MSDSAGGELAGLCVCAGTGAGGTHGIGVGEETGLRLVADGVVKVGVSEVGADQIGPD